MNQDKTLEQLRHAFDQLEKAVKAGKRVEISVLKGMKKNGEGETATFTPTGRYVYTFKVNGVSKGFEG